MTTKAECLENARRLNLPRATAQTLGVSITAKVKDAESEAENLMEAIDRYASAFAQVEGGNCPGCGALLGGLLGSFTWGIAHGEGHCRACGYPCRLYHRPKDDSGEEIFDGCIQRLLPYHPDDLEVRHDHES